LHNVITKFAKKKITIEIQTKTSALQNVLLYFCNYGTSKVYM